MKQFIKELIVFLFIATLLLEVSTRLFTLAGHTKPNEFINGDTVKKPHAEEEYVKGGLGEIRSKYHINNMGFNNKYDYELNEDNSDKIAILGDSYIEGFHSNIEQSIGQLVDDKLFHSKKQVYQFGQGGANLKDFITFYEKYNLNKFNKVIILIAAGDIVDEDLTYVNINKTTQQSIIRRVYSFSYGFRYLNINQGLLTSLKKIKSKPLKILIIKK